jgi:murein DD-endopeptidase MepM/ murein hydrolase activator NlpD
LNIEITLGRRRVSFRVALPRLSYSLSALATVAMFGASAVAPAASGTDSQLAAEDATQTASMVSALRLGTLAHAIHLRVPGLDDSRSSGSARQASLRAKALGLGTHSAGTALLGGRPEPAWALAADKFAARSETLAWPVKAGWSTRGYGSGEGGYHLAVDIMAPRGSDVRAVADGLVGYADDGLRGYGNIVMLIHADGAVSAYAHNSVNHVYAGQVVRRGELIAQVGSTGISRGPHVHFEWMVNGKNCDPTSMFRPGVPRRDGSKISVTPRIWDESAATPPVRCEPRRRHPHSSHARHAKPRSSHRGSSHRGSSHRAGHH